MIYLCSTFQPQTRLEYCCTAHQTLEASSQLPHARADLTSGMQRLYLELLAPVAYISAGHKFMLGVVPVNSGAT